MVFESLLILEIEAPVRVTLTDDDIGELSCAWPALQKFILDEHGGWGDSAPTATIEALYSLAWNCPDLELVAMPIDASALVRIPADVPADGARNEGAWQRHLGASRIGDPVVLAIVLAQIFEGRWAHVSVSDGATWNDGNGEGERVFTINHQIAVGRCMRELRAVESEFPEVFGDEKVWPP